MNMNCGYGNHQNEHEVNSRLHLESNGDLRSIQGDLSVCDSEEREI